MTVIGVVGRCDGHRSRPRLATSGYDVILVDRDEKTLSAARDSINRNCRLSALMGGPAIDADAAMERISTAVGVAALAKADMVIENVTENWDIKRDVHAQLDEVLDPTAVVIVNTSAIPITRVASVGRRPERVIGVHFMNPGAGRSRWWS